MIYFTNTRVQRTTNYFVQQLFSTNSGDTYYDPVLTRCRAADNSDRAEVRNASASPDLATSVVRDSESNDLIIKVVNLTSKAEKIQITLKGYEASVSKVVCNKLAGPLDSVNGLDERVRPTARSMTVGRTFTYSADAHSLSVLRVTPISTE